MSIEIERKFLVKDSTWKKDVEEGLSCKQAYLISDKKKTVRIRSIGDKSYLTVKGATVGISRPEFEYEIPNEDALDLFALCGTVIEKTRYYISYEGSIWELDFFYGDNEGLVIAEIELDSENQAIVFPEWIGAEVTHDKRYYNGFLAKYPYSEWA